jgi:rubrerythrin
MPEFVNPFTGVVPMRKLTDSELLRALRLDLSAEEEAVHLYLAHADATDNELAKRVLKDIAEEERVHKGEFQRLINILSGDEESFLAQGAEEVNAMAEGREPAEEPRLPVPSAQPTIRTIGDLKGTERKVV